MSQEKTKSKSSSGIKDIPKKRIISKTSSGTKNILKKSNISKPSVASKDISKNSIISKKSAGEKSTRGYLTLKWGSLTPNLLKCTRCRLAPNLLKSATWQQIC